MISHKLVELPHKTENQRGWFFFDAHFYVSQCIARGISAPLGSPDTSLKHYLDRGMMLGLSPNPLFDEDFYRQKYPNVGREIKMGRHASGFEHYIREGMSAGLSPVWFYDQAFYVNSYEDLTSDNLHAGGFSDFYCHYLQHGVGERRSAHWTVRALRIIDAAEQFPASDAALYAALLDSRFFPRIFKPLFDYEWMKEKYGFERSVLRRNFMRHYLFNVRERQLSPSPYFDESYYLESNPEIAEALRQGVFTCGYEHFLLHGMGEWRNPFAGFETTYYFEMNMTSDATRQPAVSPFAHFLTNRRAKRLAISPPLSVRDISENSGKGLYERRCALNAPVLGTIELTTAKGAPDVSVIIIARNNFEQTANTIVSAASSTRAKIEVVLFDNGSTDEIKDIPSINPSIKYLRSGENLGFTIAVNRAVEAASGRMIVLMNNDIELAPRCIDIALGALESDRTIGAIGAKIVRMHGRLQEAGSIVWRDGSCLGFGRDGDPRDGQFNFARDVDFCSGCFLAVMRADWNEFNGFDEAFAPAYYEETDFCLRLWQRGKRVVYDPRIVVWHVEFGSSSVREEPLALMRRNQRYLATKHRDYLSNCLPAAPANIERARLRHVARPRVLFIEDYVPDAKQGMGQVRSTAVADALIKHCGLLSILGLHNQKWPTTTRGDQHGRRVEILTGVNAPNITAFLRERAGLYDLVWLSRTHNLQRLQEWRAACPEFFVGVRTVLDTEAIAAGRRSAYARHAGHDADFASLVHDELEQLDGIDHICAVNTAERALLTEMLDRRRHSIPVSILGHSLAMAARLPRFEETGDIVLPGAYSEFDSPNADALRWFDEDVRPLIADMPGLNFVIAGNSAARFVAKSALKHKWRVVDNPPDMAEVYSNARIMVAPTRFAAGIPMKVHEAASHGVPVVMTELLARQLNWERPGIVAVPPTPKLMAEAIENLAQDRDAWAKTQALQARLVRADCDPSGFERAIEQITLGLTAKTDEAPKRPKQTEPTSFIETAFIDPVAIKELGVIYPFDRAAPRGASLGPTKRPHRNRGSQ